MVSAKTVSTVKSSLIYYNRIVFERLLTGDSLCLQYLRHKHKLF